MSSASKRLKLIVEASGDHRPTFVIETSEDSPWAVVTHERHLVTVGAYKLYEAEPLPPTGPGRVADLLAWGSTVVCTECGPICPFCGGCAELAVVFGTRAAWVHRHPTVAA